MGRAKKSVEVEAQVIARGNVVPMMTETESEETVQYVSDEDAAREDTDEQESEIELEVAMHPFILYRKED